jgi:hypothetical protein
MGVVRALGACDSQTLAGPDAMRDDDLCFETFERTDSWQIGLVALG